MWPKGGSWEIRFPGTLPEGCCRAERQRTRATSWPKLTWLCVEDMVVVRECPILQMGRQWSERGWVNSPRASQLVRESIFLTPLRVLSKHFYPLCQENKESGTLVEETEHNSQKEEKLGFAEWVGDKKQWHFGQRKLSKTEQDTETLMGRGNCISWLWW